MITKHVFWGEIAPSDHFLQFYESEESLLGSLEAYVSAGFINGDGVAIIATAEHISALEKVLSKNFNVKMLKTQKRYIAIDAEALLEGLLVNGEIDRSRFDDTVQGIIKDIKHELNSSIRVYGELVALLWGQGNRKAVVELEKLWHDFCTQGTICLFCAYPKRNFRQDAIESIQDICSCHSMLVEENEFRSALSFYGKDVPVPFLAAV